MTSSSTFHRNIELNRPIFRFHILASFAPMYFVLGDVVCLPAYLQMVLTRSQIKAQTVMSLSKSGGHDLGRGKVNSNGNGIKSTASEKNSSSSAKPVCGGICSSGGNSAAATRIEASLKVTPNGCYSGGDYEGRSSKFGDLD